MLVSRIIITYLNTMPYKFVLSPAAPRLSELFTAMGQHSLRIIVMFQFFNSLHHDSSVNSLYTQSTERFK